jgi:hypothetical protein
MATNQESKYKVALERLISNTPEVLSVGTYGINNDAVAMEAGSKRGAIKKSRYPELISAIRVAAKAWDKKKVSLVNKEKAKKEKAKSENEILRDRFDASLKREQELALQLDKLEKEIVGLKSKVVPFSKNM